MDGVDEGPDVQDNYADGWSASVPDEARSGRNPRIAALHLYDVGLTNKRREDDQPPEPEMGSPRKSPLPMVAVSRWLSWHLADDTEDAAKSDQTESLVVVNWLRLRGLISRFVAESAGASAGTDCLVRLNLLNLEETPIRIIGLSLWTHEGTRHQCRVVPSILLAPGVRYPLAVEASFEPKAEVAEFEVEAGAGAVWVQAHVMPG